MKQKRINVSEINYLKQSPVKEPYNTSLGLNNYILANKNYHFCWTSLIAKEKKESHSLMSDSLWTYGL